MSKINILRLKDKINSFSKEIHLNQMDSRVKSIINFNGDLRSSIIEEYGDYIDFLKCIKRFPIQFKVLDYYSQLFDQKMWFIISKISAPDLWFIEKYKHKLNLSYAYIRSGTNITEEFIENNFHLVSLNDAVNLYSNLSEDFIKKYEDQIDFDILQISQHLSEEFIKSRIDKMNLKHIIMYQTLSEEFIEKYIPDSLYSVVVTYQTVSESFAEKYREKFNMYYYLRSNHDMITPEFFDKYVDRLSKHEQIALQSIICKGVN